MAEAEWFETEDELDEIQRAFVSALRARAACWPLSPADTCLVLPDYVAYGYELAPGETGHGRLLAYLHVPDPTQNVILLTVGAYFDRERVRGDELHNQLLSLPDEPTPLALEGTGTPEELAERTADWFETVLGRPIVRHEWLRLGKVYAHRWLFADSGQPLAEGRIRAKELGPPDRVVGVRGQLR